MLCDVADIRKTFWTPSSNERITVLDDISFTLDAGRSLAITGPSGSGKTTLLNIVATLEAPDSGTVRIDGRDVSGLHEKELARMRNGRIGIVFQKHYLLPQCTLLENVLVPTLPWPRSDRNAVRKRALALLERVGLSGRMHHFPAQVSGGECQRTAVVRALINRPCLLCADEPTGSLDHASSQALGELLAELNREEHTALLVVTHARELAARMDRRFELRDGRCTETL